MSADPDDYDYHFHQARQVLVVGVLLVIMVRWSVRLETHRQIHRISSKLSFSPLLCP